MRLLILGLVSLGLAALGIRLLRLARGTRAQPERWLGLAFLLAGGSAWLLPLAASDGLPAHQARGIAFVAQAGMTATIACLVLFTWKVFRAASPLASWLAGALIAANVGAGCAVLLGATPIPTGAVGLAVILARSTALSWLFVESARSARQVRRRLRLGLGDPIVANRFVLWAISTGAVAAGWLAFFPPASYRRWIVSRTPATP